MKELLSKIYDCQKCSTINGYNKFSIKAHGNLKANAILVSEAPGKVSLIENEKYWVGAGGKILRQILPIDKELEDIFYLTDIVKCWPNEKNENRTPNENEINNCSHFLKTEIEKLKPKIIISLGNIASSFLLNRKVKVTKEHGKLYEYNEWSKLLVLLHPSGIDRFMKRNIYIDQLNKLVTKIQNQEFENVENIFTNKNQISKIASKETKVKQTIKTKTNLSNQVFFTIPSSGNSITESDVEKYQVRITADFKDFFPNQSTEIECECKNVNYTIKFIHKGTRSHIVKFGRVLSNLINLKSGMNIKFKKLGIKRYKIE